MQNIAADVTGYVLAGGRSSRMGQDKALLQIDGEPLVEHALRRLRKVCIDVAILSGPACFERDAILDHYARVVSDTEVGNLGPLAGITAALADCATKYALFLAVDQPGVSIENLHLLTLAAKDSAAGAVCFALQDVPEPLPLLLACDLHRHLHHVLSAGERRLLPGVRAAVTRANRTFLLVPFSGPEDSFTNLNTRSDFSRWQQRHTTSNHSGSAASD